MANKIVYHASPVQDIKRFRLSEDTSGNGKGKVIFASKYPEFASAFGVRWNDANARLKTEAKKNVRPVVVEVTPLKIYYNAEDYHQDYLENNPGGYCHINPELFKVAKNANKKNDQ